MASERFLIEKARAGDAGAFDKLIRRYEDRIFRLAKNVCSGLPAEAEDVYQETFLTAFKKLGAFRSDSGLGTWLYRIAANLCWMRFREKKREPFVPLLDERKARGGHDADIWSATPEEAAKKKELSAAVAKALGELPVDYRLVLTLRDIEGLSGEETARILKLSLPAVKSRLHRGRLFLRDRLGPHVGGKAEKLKVPGTAKTRLRKRLSR